MQLQHADPHDAIAAQLRALSTAHAKDPSGPDVNDRDSRLIGIEYIISEKVFRTLPEEVCK